VAGFLEGAATRQAPDHDRALCACLRALRLVDEGGLPSEHALIQTAATLHNFTIHRHTLPWQHSEHISFPDAGCGHAHHFQSLLGLFRPLRRLYDKPALCWDQLRQGAQISCTWGNTPPSITRPASSLLQVINRPTWPSCMLNGLNEPFELPQSPLGGSMTGLLSAGTSFARVRGSATRQPTLSPQSACPVAAETT